MSKLNKPIIVACPPFDEQSGGCIVLHYLTHRLRGMGVEAYVFPLPEETPSGAASMLHFRRRPFRTHPEFDTPLAPFSALRSGIVVYPEIVKGNPLGCAHVARWILFSPRGFAHALGEDFAKPIPGEEVFYFQLPFIEPIDWIPRANQLRLQWLREDIFNDPGLVERTEVCRMIRKGAATADSPPPGAKGATMLDGKSNAEIAAVFKRARLFYCHDPYTMYCDYAALCGCLPIVVPPPALSRTDWRPETDRLGIAYGDSPEQLEWAARTRSDLIDRIKDLKGQEDGMLRHFISRLASAYSQRPAKGSKTFEPFTSRLASSPDSVEKLVAPRPDFLGEIDESRLIGHFRDNLTGGDKLALQTFLLREFDLGQLEAPRGAAEASSVVERHESLRTEVDLLCLNVEVLRACEADLAVRLFNLLSSKGLVCIESNDEAERMDADLLPGGAFESVMAAPGFFVFAQTKGERAPRSVRYQTDLFRRKRYFERKHLARLAAEPKTPEVAVFVLTYKHEAFIAECLRSIMKQRGQFRIRVLIIDDASPDNTAQVARSVIAENRDDRIRFELRVNPQNVGASANWGPALSWAEGADYVSPTDGDDFWNSDVRIQEHIDFLREHPAAIMSFNSYEFCTVDSSSRRRGVHLDEEIVSADRIVKDNPVGNLGSTFYRGELVEIFPLEPFYYTNGDWKINVYCSQIGSIGYLDKALSVYRLHGGGVWSLKAGVERIIPTIDGILKYNNFIDYCYNKQYNWLIRESFRVLGNVIFDPVDDFGKVDLVILHDDFPQKGEFHYAEFTSYLREFPSSLLLATLDGKYQRQYPELGSRLIEDDGTFPLHLGKQVYLATLRMTYKALPRIEAAGVPFIFTLCPEGGFVLKNPDVDRQLQRIFGSPRFRGVIVTHQVIYDYVVGKGLCPGDKVEVILGGVMPQSLEALSIRKRRWGSGKASLDICFVAQPSALHDKDVGYDVFVEVAKALRRRHDDLYFHVVGSLSPCALDVSSLDDRIKFYGSRTLLKSDVFFRDMDLILSPTLRGKTPSGAIHCFPTKYCVEAGARGVAIFTADELNAAKGRFKDGEDIVLVEPNAKDIIGKIERYYDAPEALTSLGERGAQSIQALYGPRSQMAPRINLLREAIHNSTPVGEELALKLRIAAMQWELMHRDDQLAAMMKKKKKLPRLLRGLRRFLSGRSNTTAMQILEVYRLVGFRGVKRALRNIGS